MTSSTSKPTTPASKSAFEKLWGKSVANHGYAAVPRLLIRAQSRLGLSPVQMNIVLQLLEYWMEPTRMPFPSKKDLAGRMGVAAKTVQTNIAELEKAGLVRREKRKTAAGDWNTNVYHLDGLVQQVRAKEPAFRAEKEARAKRRKDAETPAGKRAP